MVVATVLEPAKGAVSATRTTSPPMLLGRKLLKKVATRNDDVSVRKGRRMLWAPSRIPQRHALASTITPYSASASSSHAGEACRAAAHSRPISTFVKSTASSTALTASLTHGTRTARVRAALEEGRSSIWNLHRISLNAANCDSYVDLPAASPYNFPLGAVKILMIAPEPFFEPRGTPFSEYHRIRALAELGHTV